MAERGSPWSAAGNTASMLSSTAQKATRFRLVPCIRTAPVLHSAPFGSLEANTVHGQWKLGGPSE